MALDEAAGLHHDSWSFGAKAGKGGLFYLSAWDSLRHLQMVMALEQQYGIEIDTDQIENIKSVAAVIRLVENACA